MFCIVQEFFSSRGMPIRALGGESVKDVIDVTCKNYCGINLPFSHLLVLFDEFGRYTEFATTKRQIAGSGVLQDLFEAIQANTAHTTFVGFIQFELNAYVQRVNPEYRNDILRYVTRYQSARKTYLSTNLETLIANLLEKKDAGVLSTWFGHDLALQESQSIRNDINSWFPQSRNHRLWIDPKLFHQVVRTGCWPLSPHATWFFYYLAAAGKHLQERSALTLLGDAITRVKEKELEAGACWTLSLADLWSPDLCQELLSSEETGQQGSVAHAYTSVESRYKAKLSDTLLRLLRTIVLTSKLGMDVDSEDEAIRALTVLSGLDSEIAAQGLEELATEYNVIEWDPTFNQFLILGDAASRSQFVAFLQKRVAVRFDDQRKAELFASRVADWCDCLGEVSTDFGADRTIKSREWRYQSVISDLHHLGPNLSLAVEQWNRAFGVDEAKGVVTYCYLESDRDPELVAGDVQRLLRGLAKRASQSCLPLLIVLLYDEDGQMGRAIAELVVLEEKLSAEDEARFGSLVRAHAEKMKQLLVTRVEEAVKQRRYVTTLSSNPTSQRLGQVAKEIFAATYKHAIPFPFDGFETSGGNAKDSCLQFTTDLLRGRLDWDNVMSMQPMNKNRAVMVLQKCWEVFNTDGTISRRPAHPTIRKIFEKWDQALKTADQRLSLDAAIRELLLPPYGASLAAAGLLLGVYLAPRLEESVIHRRNEEIPIAKWRDDDLFRGKMLNLPALRDTVLIRVAETTSEWKELLDLWSGAQFYAERQDYLEQGLQLREKLSFPPAEFARFETLRERSEDAVTKTKERGLVIEDAIRKIENGYAGRDLRLLSWGAAMLVELKDKMEKQQAHWTAREIAELSPHIERGRQATIQFFTEWLPEQRPRSNTPDHISQFKHAMLNMIGSNLKKLGLREQYDALEKAALAQIRNADAIAQARQTIHEVGEWIDQNADACRLPRMAIIRGLQSTGKQFGSKLQGLAKRLPANELTPSRERLSQFLGTLKEAYDSIDQQATALWRSKIASEEDVAILLRQVEELIAIYEGVDEDLEDLRLMREALRAMDQAHSQLTDMQLSWASFEALAARVVADVPESISGAELPWAFAESLGVLTDKVAKRRQQKSLEWVQALETESAGLAEMTIQRVNQLHSSAGTPPRFVTEAHAERAAKVVRHAEGQLQSLEVEWLIEKFKQLLPTSRKKFLALVSKLSDKPSA